MILEPAPTATIYQISEEEQRQIAQKHFALFYTLVSECKAVPDAAFEEQRCFSGLPIPYYNAILGAQEGACIETQMQYFNDKKVPFVWYVEENSDPAFEQKLISSGFQDCRTLTGAVGFLASNIPDPKAPDGYTLELVQSEAAMQEFSELVCNTFGMQNSRDVLQKVMWQLSHHEKTPMLHYLARKEGKAVSAVSALIAGDVVSFWNGASLPEVRGQGLNTALRYLALQEAVSKGCRIGISYLMPDGMAFGICSKLGFQPRWKFRVFSSPPKKDMHWISQFDLFLFDFDGLLVDTESLHYEAYMAMLRGEGENPTWDFAKFSSFAHLGSETLKTQLYLEFPDIDPNWAHLYAEKTKHYFRLLAEGKIELMPGVQNLLEALAEKNIRRCVVTNSSLEQIESIRAQFPILQTIPHWITRRDYTHPKPNPESYLLAIERYGKEGDRIIGFEDSIRGWQALSKTPALALLICQDDYPLLNEAKNARRFTSLDLISF